MPKSLSSPYRFLIIKHKGTKKTQVLDYQAIVFFVPLYVMQVFIHLLL
jgi:hypothetical protein